MRIIQSLEGKSWSGGQQQTLHLTKGLQAQGHDVLLVCHADGDLEQRALEQGLNVIGHPFRREFDISEICRLYRIFREFQPDLVNVHRAWAHTQWLMVSLLTRFRGLIVTRRVLFEPDRNPVSLVKYRSAVVRGYIAVSRSVAQRLQNIGIAARRIRVVHSATDSSVFVPQRSLLPPESWPVPPGAPVAVLVGNYSRNKGHDLLLEAFDQMWQAWPQLHLVLIGHNTDHHNLVQSPVFRKAANRIHVLGFRRDVAQILPWCRFLVNASTEEGFPGSTREGLCCGLPVVAADIPAHREIHVLTPLHLFVSGSAADLARAMLSLQFQQPDNRQKVEQVQAMERWFSTSALIDHTLSAYRSICPELAQFEASNQ